MESLKNGIIYGQCRCCLKHGYHRNILKEYQKDSGREVYYNVFAECFNLYVSSVYPNLVFSYNLRLYVDIITLF